MRVLVFGANGFVGRNVCNELKTNHEVFEATRAESDDDHSFQVDLLDEASVGAAVEQSQPDVVVNCAGIIGAGAPVEHNVTFTENILKQSALHKIGKVVISGSAGEYGQVSPDELPVSETTPLRAAAGYGLAKVEEENFALKFGREHNLGVVVMRIFNPIGPNMANRFLITNLLGQIEECRRGEKNEIELSRLDSERDYVSISDVAKAFRLVVEGDPRESVYNVGSGVATSNGELVELLLSASNLPQKPSIKETSPTPEPQVASQADITRLTNEFGWRPERTLESEIERIVNARRK